MQQKNLLPTIRLNGVEVTRLIIGGNPFQGNSHFSEELNREMAEYYTCANAVKALFACEENGINAMLSRGDRIIFNIVRTFREQGGSLHWICQTASEHPDTYQNIREIASLNPLGIYYHGTETDRRWKAGQIDTIRDHLKAIRDTGTAVGLGSHMPEVFRYVEEKGWDIDFYTACFYNVSKVERGSILAGAPRVEEPFDDPDRDIMCKFIRSTSRTCLAFKILGAGRKCRTYRMVKEAFRFAFSRIKQTDAVVVGMFPKYHDQVNENSIIVRDLLQNFPPHTTWARYCP
ncbi:MAG: hypothetical protein V2A65_02265 [Candidatus Omnitrophota bacterium]